MIDQPSSYLCAFCDMPTDDDPRYVHIELAFRSDNAAHQAFGAHWNCLRAAISPTMRAGLHEALS